MYRYDLVGSQTEITPNPRGKYVSVEDVEKLLKELLDTCEEHHLAAYKEIVNVLQSTDIGLKVGRYYRAVIK